MDDGKVKPISRVDRFISNLLKDPEQNQAKAARNAGYSAKTAASQASRLLKNVKVRRALEEFRSRREKRTKIEAEQVLEQLSNIAMLDIGEAFSENGSFLPIKEIPLELRRLIASIEVQEVFEGKGAERTLIGYLRKIKFHDKLRALELMGKHHKQFTDRILFEDAPGRADRLREARERAKRGV